MKGTKARTVNTLGMFDLFKGIGMATVIFVHTADPIPSIWAAVCPSQVFFCSSTGRR